MRKYILFAFVWACVLSACSEKGIMEYSDNTLYVYFAADATKDSTTYSFKAYPSGEIHVKIPMKCDGVWEREDREYTRTLRLYLPICMYCQRSVFSRQDNCRIRLKSYCWMAKY